MFRLARLSLANRAIVGLITLLIAGFGVLALSQLKQELLPAIDIPETSIITVVPGASPEVIDRQVGEPVSRAVTGLKHVERVVSTSYASMSMVQVSYEYGTPPETFEASVRQALDRISSRLPEGAEPNIVTGSTSDIPVIFLTASREGATTSELTDTMTQVIVPRLEGIDGVRAADISGGAQQDVVITPNHQRLAANGLTPQVIAETLNANGMTLPMGAVERDGIRLPVQGGTPVTTLKELGALPVGSVTRPGTVVPLGQLAQIEIATRPATSITRMNGMAAVSVSITPAQGADVVAISHAVKDTVADLAADHTALQLTVVFDQAEFIEQSIRHVATEGLLGLVFAVVVILMFLFSVRSTLVTAISIPLSVLVAFLGLMLGGYSLNMLTLGALTIAIGRVVDDSIVVVENIKRHLSYGEEKSTAILTGVREVASAITSSTLTTVAVFVPIAVVSGVVGELFAPFALTVTIAMLSSLLVALTIVPVLSYWFLPQPAGEVDADAVRRDAEAKEHNSRLQRAYKPTLRLTQRHPVITLAVAALILLGTGFAVPLLKVDFLGDTGQNMAMVSQEFPPGSSLDTISKGAAQVEDALADIDGVESVLTMAGSGDGTEITSSFGAGSTATYVVNTDPSANQAGLKQAIRDRLATMTDAGELSLVDANSMSGFGGTVDVKVTSANEADLAPATEKVEQALAGLPHVAESSQNLAAAEPTIRVDVDRDAALRVGYTEVQLLGMVAGVLSPPSVGTVTIDAAEYAVLVRPSVIPRTPEELAAFPVPTAAGPVTLGDLATITTVDVPTSFTREGGDLVATVSLTPDDGELGTVTGEVTDRLAALDLPDGTSATIGGLAEQQRQSFEQLGLAMVVAVALVFLLLVGTFRSLLQPLILLVSIPFAGTGAVGLLLITGRPLGISALIGMLMLIGIVVTNAIVLIDLVNQYRRSGQSLDDAVFNGARQRLRPILMTALATIFALIPMAIGITGSSGFISQDLAIVVIGGLISSTALTLILVPVLYRLFEQHQGKRRRAVRA